MATLRSNRTLRDYAEFRGMSVRDISNKTVNKAGRRVVAPATVGHLMSGFRKTCRDKTAIAIEEALACPPGALFDLNVSRVADNRR